MRGNGEKSARIAPGEELFSRLSKDLGLKPCLPSPARCEGKGPYQKLLIKNVTIIDGTGSPAYGPADVFIEEDRIKTIASFAYTNKIDGPAVENEIDGTGKYLLPGFVDSHVHIGYPFPEGFEVPAEYVFKLWMAHGVTTVRDAGCLVGLQWTIEHQEKSAANEITAPRIVLLALPGVASYGIGPNTQEEFDLWLDEVAALGVNGVKWFGGPPSQTKALIEGAKKRGLSSACHNTILYSTRTNVIDLAKMGLTSLEHSLGLPESLISTHGGVQPLPADYNHNDEQSRAFQDMRIWLETDPGGALWNKTLDTLLECGLTLVPTFSPWEQGRDVQRALWAEWHGTYTLPVFWEFFMPKPGNHWAFYRDWTTAMEIEYRKGMQVWMQFVNEYKNLGGRVCTGSDVGFGLKLYGFDYIREFEVMQEAGFSPLEVIRAATLHGAMLVDMDDEIGTIEAGKKADLVLVDENPLSNFKLLYGTGHLRYNDETDEVERIRGVRYTIKDGIIYDAHQLLDDVSQIVAENKKALGM